MAAEKYQMEHELVKILKDKGSYDLLYDILCELEVTIEMLVHDVDDVNEFCSENKITTYKNKLHVKKLIRLLKEKNQQKQQENQNIINEKKKKEKEEKKQKDDDAEKKAKEIKNMKTDYKMKVLIIGDSEVGKTTLVNRYMSDEFVQYGSTFGYDQKYVVQKAANGKTMKMLIIDCGGQERHFDVCRQTYRKTDLVLLCYSVDNVESFQHCQAWRERIANNAPDDAIVMLIGCKCDIKDRPNELTKLNVERSIKTDKKWNKYLETDQDWLVECSSKTGHNISSIFFTAIEMMVKKRERQTREQREEEQRQEQQLKEMRKKMNKKPQEVVQDMKKKSECFSFESFVITYPDYERKQICDLKIYDKILSYDPNNKTYFWEQILVKYHFEKNEYLHDALVPMIQFTLKNNEKLAMTSNHLLYVGNDIKSADTIKIGDKLNHFKYKEVEVISIDKVMKYPRNILTYNGNLVINECAISSFCSTIKGESVYYGETFRYVLNNYYQSNVIRYPMYYLSKLWREYIPFNIKYCIAELYFE